MGMRLEIKRKLLTRSDRVKCVDLHPTEPWVLASLYNGNVYVWNYETQALVKTFEVTDLPVRTAKFVARKSWVLTGSDDLQMRVFNYNTHEKVTSFEAHTDYIRSIAVHPTQPYILSSADDMTIKLWDWDKSFKCIRVFEGHTHYVMQVTFNPKDTNTFASCSLDHTIKVWNLGSSVANFTLEGHSKGVNCVDYYYGGDKPYIASGADDKQVKIWDYQNKSCVQNLERHSQNVSVACFHPELPIIISGSEDGTIRIWHANTYRLENTLEYALGRVWCVAYQKGGNNVAFGYDEGTVVIKLGREEPAVSMDNSGKIIWAKHNDIQTANLKTGADAENIKDGERLALPVKDLGSCEVYPQTLQHSRNGRFVVVCGDGEYIIYTALAWRSKSFGSALDFAWALDSNEYAVRESTSKIRLYKNFKEKTDVSLKLGYSAEAIFGGCLLGVNSSSSLNLYDWDGGNVVRRIDVVPKNIYWADTGDYVAICCEDNFYILRYNKSAYLAHIEKGLPIGEEGVEEAFEFVTEISENVKTGSWVGDCFIYTNTANRVNYVVGGQMNTVYHADSPVYLLGYIPRDNRIYLCDKDLNVFSYSLSVSVIEYQTAVLHEDMETAARLLPSIPQDQRNRIARFLESRNLRELALEVSTDPEHKFDLAILLGKLDFALQIAREVDTEGKWKIVADAAMAAWKIPLAEECFRHAQDLSGLLLIYSATGDVRGLRELSERALAEGQNNIAFTSLILLGAVDECLEILVTTDRMPEAAMFARTYLPSQTSRVVKLWKERLVKDNKAKAAEALADPVEYENLFPNFQEALAAEQAFLKQRSGNEISPTTKKQILSTLPEGRSPRQTEASPTAPNSGPLRSPLSGRGVRPGSAGGMPAIDISGGGQEEVASPPVVNFAPQAVYMESAKSANGPFPDEDPGDGISDNMSHMSMEVNTTGTGSEKGEDFDELASLE